MALIISPLGFPEDLHGYNIDSLLTVIMINDVPPSTLKFDTTKIAGRNFEHSKQIRPADSRHGFRITWTCVQVTTIQKCLANVKTHFMGGYTQKQMPTNRLIVDDGKYLKSEPNVQSS